MSDTAHTHELKTDVAGLIRLLAKNLYAQSDVFLREMIQNANDSIMRRREIEQGQAAPGLIYVRVSREKDAARIVFEDNGAGLTEQEIHDYLSTIGRSGTDAFRKDLQEKGRYAEASNLIGQFGIGLLSTFVVAKHVVVESRSCRPNSIGWRWECWGDKHYQLTQNNALTRIGSRVTLYIDEQHLHVLDTGFIRQAVRKYADFIEVPIHLNDEGRINSVDAPWHHSYASEHDRLEAYEAFVRQRFPDSPLAVIPIDMQEPYPVKGVLYISDLHRGDLAAPGRVDIYQSRMFIVADHPDMLPPWAKFINGVIDSPALTPTAARDNIQQDGVAIDIRSALGRVVIAHLKDMAQANLPRFQEIMDWHHYHIKGMALDSEDFFQEVADLLPFETNQGSCSLYQYLERAVQDRNGRRTILYFSERGQATQFFMLANAKGIPVINASYSYEELFLKKYAREFPNVKLEQLDFSASELIFQPLTAEEADRYRALLTECNRQLPTAGSNAKIVRFKPTTIPAVITLTESHKVRRQLDALKNNPVLSNEIRDLLGHVSKEKPEIPVTIYLNANNATIQALSMLNLRTDVASNAIRAIYSNALMLAQHLITPQNAELMFAQFNRVIDLLIEQTSKLDILQQQAKQIEQVKQPEQASQPTSEPHSSTLRSHVSCYLLASEQPDTLFQALTALLQDRPYYWQLVRAENREAMTGTLPLMPEALVQADCFVVEMSHASPEHMLELGMMLALKRPLLLLCAQDAVDGTKQLAAFSQTAYQLYDRQQSPDGLAEQLNAILQQQAAFQQLASQGRPKFLSTGMLHGAGLSATLVEAVCRAYSTVEAFLHAEPTQIAEQLTASKHMIAALQEYVRDYCA